jgi:hypothetical protein
MSETGSKATRAAARLMVVLDATVVNVALPHIQRALGFSRSGLEWVASAYALAWTCRTPRRWYREPAADWESTSPASSRAGVPASTAGPASPGP